MEVSCFHNEDCVCVVLCGVCGSAAITASIEPQIKAIDPKLTARKKVVHEYSNMSEVEVRFTLLLGVLSFFVSVSKAQGMEEGTDL